MFDVPTMIRRKVNGESWDVLAKEAGVPVTTLRGRCKRAGYGGQRSPRRLGSRRNKSGAMVTPIAAVALPSEDSGSRRNVEQVEAPAFERGTVNGPLVAKYRPQTLGEVLGQPEIVAGLQQFVESSYSCAMLFSGDSGIGKTSAAYALAKDLGCAVEEKELGGVIEIPSGSQTADTVRGLFDLLRYRPLCGSGWRVLMVNECDRMALPVETLWLDMLEHLPKMTVVIFTTNEPGRLSQRFRNRCEEYGFQGGSERLKPWIDALARRLWEREKGTPMPASVTESLGLPTLGAAESMTASFRLAVQQLQQRMRGL